MKRCFFVLVIALLLSAPMATVAQHKHQQGKSTEAPAKTAPVKSTTPQLKPAEGASIKILAPAKNQVFKGDRVDIHYQLTKGKRGHHAHAYVDGELVGMFETEKGTLNGIKPGKHTLELRVVAEDHQTELNAIDKVDFTVK